MAWNPGTATIEAPDRCRLALTRATRRAEATERTSPQLPGKNEVFVEEISLAVAEQSVRRDWCCVCELSASSRLTICRIGGRLSEFGISFAA